MEWKKEKEIERRLLYLEKALNMQDSNCKRLDDIEATLVHDGSPILNSQHDPEVVFTSGHKFEKAGSTDIYQLVTIGGSLHLINTDNGCQYTNHYISDIETNLECFEIAFGTDFEAIDG